VTDCDWQRYPWCRSDELCDISTAKLINIRTSLSSHCHEMLQLRQLWHLTGQPKFGAKLMRQKQSTPTLTCPGVFLHNLQPNAQSNNYFSSTNTLTNLYPDDIQKHCLYYIIHGELLE